MVNWNLSGRFSPHPCPRIYEGGARRARGVPHPDAEKFLFEAVCPDFGLKQLPGWVGSSPPSVRTGVLRIMVRLPPAIVYYRFAARSTTELWCDCHRQSFIIDSLRGAPPLINEGSKDSIPSVRQTPIYCFPVKKRGCLKMICENHEGRPSFLHEAVEKLLKKCKKQRTNAEGQSLPLKKYAVFSFGDAMQRSGQPGAFPTGLFVLYGAASEDYRP